jgi:hypothetical protein
MIANSVTDLEAARLFSPIVPLLPWTVSGGSKPGIQIVGIICRRPELTYRVKTVLFKYLVERVLWTTLFCAVQLAGLTYLRIADLSGCRPQNDGSKKMKLKGQGAASRFAVVVCKPVYIVLLGNI